MTAVTPEKVWVYQEVPSHRLVAFISGTQLPKTDSLHPG